jgi:hypothetical protein
LCNEILQRLYKEAYLDLSKPYQQNNPQSAKQDNQATTILKEVAGAARTALGSTNSGNTDQLGKKVTTDIKNQAINKTEGLVNDKANKFLNAFGAGRSEVSINGSWLGCLAWQTVDCFAGKAC